MTKLSSGIYRIENLQADKRYFGQSVTLHKREKEHLSMFKRGFHDNSHFQNAWNKYGEDAFKFSIMIYCEPFELTKYEQFFVNLYPPEKLYNIRRECVDSNFGLRHSDEAREKMSVAKKGIYPSEETCAKNSEAHRGNTNLLGYKHTEEARAKMSGENNHNFGKQMSEETRHKLSEAFTGELNPMFGKYGELNPMFGTHRSAETRAKISIAQKGELGNNFGRFMPENTRLKLREANTGRHFSEETKQKMSEARILYWKNKKEGG